MKRLKTVLAGVALMAGLSVQGAGSAEFVVGNVSEMTGSNAAIGTRVVRAVSIAVEEINKSNYLDGNTVKLIQDDNASDKGQSLTILNRYALQDNAIAVVGPAATPLGLAMAPQANELKIPILFASYAPAVVESGPWAFKIAETPGAHLTALAEHAVDRLQVKKCVTFFGRDNEGFVALSKLFAEYATSKGVEILSEDSTVATETDFNAVATKIASLEPDCLQLAVTAEVAANLLLQARSAGMSPDTKIIGGSAQVSAQFLKSAGPIAEGVYAFADYAPGGVNEEGRNFEAAYRARYNETPDNWAAVGYAQMKLIAWAIKQAGPEPTREKVRDALASARDVPTIIGQTGLITMDQHRIGDYESPVLVVKDGQFVAAPN